MNAMSVSPHPTAVKQTARFVPATAEAQANMERQIGRNLYRRGKPIECCVTDEMTQGYLDAEQAGFMAYSRHMEAEGIPCAVAFSVNWTGEGWR